MSVQRSSIHVTLPLTTATDVQQQPTGEATVRMLSVPTSLRSEFCFTSQLIVCVYDDRVPSFLVTKSHNCRYSAVQRVRFWSLFTVIVCKIFSDTDFCLCFRFLKSKYDALFY